jgi:hypothetical protein
MERLFFGAIESDGRDALPHLADFQGLTGEALKSFQSLTRYMGAQRFRTQRGLDDIKRAAADAGGLRG